MAARKSRPSSRKNTAVSAGYVKLRGPTSVFEQMVRSRHQLARQSIPLENPESFSMFDNRKRGVPNLSEFELIYLMHPLAYRGIEVRTSDMFARDYDILGDSEKVRTRCEEWLEDVSFDIQMTEAVRNAYIYGNSYLELVPGKDKEGRNTIVEVIPLDPKITDFQTDGSGNIIFGPDKKPLGFEQTSGRKKIKFTNPVVHLAFVRHSGELRGISLLVACFRALVYDLNIQQSVSTAIERHGFPQYDVKVGTPERPANRNVIDTVASKLEDLKVSNEFVHSHEVEVKVLESTSARSYDAYNRIFIKQIVSCIGVPEPILLGSGESSNRSTAFVQSRHYRGTIEHDQLVVKQVIEKGIFRVLADMENWSEIPKIEWKEVLPEDETARTGQAATLFEKGIVNVNEAREMIGLPPYDFGDASPAPLNPFQTPQQPQTPVAKPAAGPNLVGPETRGAPVAAKPEQLPNKESVVIPTKTGPQAKGRAALVKLSADLETHLNGFFETVRNEALNRFFDSASTSENLQSIQFAPVHEHFTQSKREFGDWTYKTMKYAMRLGLSDAMAEGGVQGEQYLSGPELDALNKRVEIVSERVFSDLSSKAVFELQDSASKKQNPDEIRARFNAFFSGYGCNSCENKPKQTRAKLIAKDNVWAAYNEGLLVGYAKTKQETVSQQLSSCKNCPNCSARPMQNISLEAAKSRLPLHPGCECYWGKYPELTA